MIKIDMDNGWYGRAKDLDLWLSRTTLSGTHRAMVDCVVQETYGWHDDNSPKELKIKQRKTQAQIPYRTFCEFAWIGKTVVSRALKELCAWGIILRDRNFFPAMYSFNPQVEEWSQEVFRVNRIDNSYEDSQQLIGQEIVNRIANSYQDSEQLIGQGTNSYEDSKQSVNRIANSFRSNSMPPNGMQALKERKEIKESTTTSEPIGSDTENVDNSEKEEQPKEEKPLKYAEDSREYKAAVWFKLLVEPNYTRPCNPDLQKWSHTFHLLFDVDKIEPALVYKIGEWATKKSEFWKANILSPSKLREKLDQLRVQMESEQNHHAGSGSGKKNISTEKCWNCKGAKNLKTQSFQGPCPICQGKGYADPLKPSSSSRNEVQKLGDMLDAVIGTK